MWRVLCTLLSVLSYPAGLAAATLTDPYVQVVFGGSGTVQEPSGGHTLGGATAPSWVQGSRSSAANDVAIYELNAIASFGLLGASSEQWGNLPNGGTRARNATAFFWDRLLVTVPGSTESTYRWQATVRLTGNADWSATGSGLPAPTAVGLAQSVRLEGQTGITHYPAPEFDPIGAKGTFDQVLALPEIPVPANQEFNYRLLLFAATRLATSADGGTRTTEALSDFLGTLRVIGISVKDSSGTPLDFHVMSASGALYTENGISAVPEPSSFALSLAGAWLLLRLRRSRRG